MPLLPNWHVWKFSKLNNCHARTAYRHRNLNTTEWQNFLENNQTPPQEELCLLKASWNKSASGKKNFDKGDYGFFLGISKEFQKEGVRYSKKTNKSKESEYGFLYKDIISECSWMHPKINGQRIQKQRIRPIFIYKKEKAWLETPLHFCCWLGFKRALKQQKSSINKQRKREQNNARKRLKYATDPKYRACIDFKRKLHKYKNIEKHREWQRTYVQKRRLNYGFRLKQNARSRFWKVMKSVKKQQTTDSFNSFIGCSSSFLQSHIEKQFIESMSWENYGSFWEVDHKIPLKFFDLNNKDQAKQAFHFSNLQPATLFYNRSKQARWLDT